MKVSLEGRVIGYNIPHLLAPSQVKDGEPLNTTRTEWGHFEVDVGVGAIVKPLHGGSLKFVANEDIHTTMPEGYEHA